MLRILALVLVAIVALPTASAAQPGASVKVTPPPFEGQQGDPYYLWANLTQPQLPRGANADDSCWKDAERPPPGPDDALLQLAADIAAWDPLQETRLSGWFPECIATQIASSSATTRVAYDVTTGRYYLFLDQGVVSGGGLPTNAPIPLPLGFFFQVAVIETTGTTGVSMVTDCEQCPPPV